MTERHTQEGERLRILVLYARRAVRVNTVREYLMSWALYSRHDVKYAAATGTALCTFDLDLFDVIIIHYSVRLNVENHLSVSYAEALSKYSGLKVLFIQDEYDRTETARQWISRLGIALVYTCVPPEYVEAVYPRARFPGVEFINTLTGFVPIGFEAPRRTRPLSERKYVLGYRGRELSYWYGDLSREKLTIGVRMKQICNERGIPASIDWKESERIYGPDWYAFLENCRATLGTESGASIFDDHGNLRRQVMEALQENPALSYDEIHAKLLAEHEGKIRMNQISPRIFEAVACGTALVCFEGAYSGVIRPDAHFVPLRKDFSNVDEVLSKLGDLDYLEKMVRRAQEDLIRSGRYSYREFVRQQDELFAGKVTKAEALRFVSLALGVVSVDRFGNLATNLAPLKSLGESLVTSMPVGVTDLEKLVNGLSSVATQGFPGLGRPPRTLKSDIKRGLSRISWLDRPVRFIYRPVRALLFRVADLWRKGSV